MPLWQRASIFLGANIALIAPLSLLFYREINEVTFMFIAAGCVSSFGGLIISRPLMKLHFGVRTVSEKDPESSPYGWLVPLVKELSIAAGMKKTPEVGVYQSDDMNAFATGMCASRSLVAFSSGLLKRLSEENIAAVAAHEISHIANGDMLTLTLVQSTVQTVLLFVTFPLRLYRWFLTRDRKNEGHYLVVILSFCIFVVSQIIAFFGKFVFNGFSRAREFRADAGAAALVGSGATVAALVKLEETTKETHRSDGSFAAFKIVSPPSFMELFSTHPRTERRILSLENPMEHGNSMGLLLSLLSLALIASTIGFFLWRSVGQMPEQPTESRLHAQEIPTPTYVNNVPEQSTRLNNQNNESGVAKDDVTNAIPLDESNNPSKSAAEKPALVRTSATDQVLGSVEEGTTGKLSTSQEMIGWSGVYSYEEFAPPNQSWVYELVVSQTGKESVARLTIDGFQTMARVLCDAVVDGDKLLLKFSSYEPDTTPVAGKIAVGETLFTLEKENNGALMTHWGKLTAQLPSNQVSGNQRFVVSKKQGKSTVASEAVAPPSTEEWEGVWQRTPTTPWDEATITITRTTGGILRVEISAAEGCHACQFSGDASITGDTMSISDDYSGENCLLERSDEAIIIRPTPSLSAACGMGGHLDGTYVKGEAVERSSFVPDIFVKKDDLLAFSKLTRDDYLEFMKMFHLTTEEDDLDKFGARVQSGYVRGCAINMAAIIMKTDNNTLWAAITEWDAQVGGSGGTIVKYYTNSSQWRERLPRTIVKWVNNIGPEEVYSVSANKKISYLRE